MPAFSFAKRAKPVPRKKRSPRGMGSIYPNRGGWRAKVYLGRKGNGQPHYVYRWAATQAELLEKIKLVKPPGPTITVAEWCERWFAGSTAKAPTRTDIRHTLDRFVIPTLGHLRLLDLTPYAIENAARLWAKPLGSLNANTLRKNLGQLSTCLEAARRAKVIAENPAKDARRPRPAKVKVDPFTADELARIIAAPDAGIFALLASVGCRLGEAIALDVGDFDATTGLLSITKTHDRKHGTRPPKSENGVRTVRVPRQALPAFRLAIGKRRSGPLFPNRDGARQEQGATRKLFGRFLARLGIRYRNPHQMRHSCASTMVLTAPVADVAKYLGDSVKTIIAVYLHPTGYDVAGAMEDALGRGGKSTSGKARA